MAKYVIEIEDVPFGRNDDPVIPHGMDELYRAKGFKSLVFDQNGLDKLTPYTEPDRKAIEDAQEEAWKMASKCLWAISNSQSRVIFGMDCVYVPRDVPYQEAKAKYKAWKEQEEQIRVGDEVKHKQYEWKAVVINISESGLLTLMWGSGEASNGFDPEEFEKTGKHCAEVEELIKKINEVQHNEEEQ